MTRSQIPEIIPFLAITSLALATGCQQLEEIQDTIDGATSRFVVEGVLLGVEPPDDETVALALEETDFGEGARLTVFLADAADVTSIEDAPITGVDLVALSDASGGQVSVNEEGGGEYGASGEDGLVYGDGEEVLLKADFEDQDRRLTVQAPVAPEPGLERTHTAGEPLEVDLSAGAFDAALVVVIDTASSEIVFSNEPSDIQELYDFSHGEGELVVEVPGAALTDETVYAVGVAGMVNADADDLENVNTVLSTFLAGKFTFTAVCTLPEAALCEQ